MNRVAVVGAGVTGLATAWFLQEHDVDVTVFDRTGVAAGASWGNAGLVVPALTAPLPAPGVLTFGLRALLNPASPVSVSPRPDPELLRFLTGFARHSSQRRWAAGARTFVPLDRLALEAFDQLAAGGAGTDGAGGRAGPLIAAYRTERERDVLLAELDHLRAAGREPAFDLLTGDEARAAAPALSGAVGAAVRLHAQRHVDPGRFVHALAASVTARGGTVRTGVESAAVTAVADTGADVEVRIPSGTEPYDAVVLATGAALGRLARRFGVRRVVMAGRGYSCSVPVDPLPATPLYFPAARVACTPIGGRLRLAGMMEFRRIDAPPDARRVRAVADAVRPLLTGADVDDQRDVWVGARPCTPDGLPLVGATRSPRVFVTGGHGMWGVTLGPATGRLLAERIVTGRLPPELAPFDPLR
ncbi:FAD-dependent oxidoreductase [Jiangella ureilytica]|uniref:FAD-dependent oxidoreductase n=1 Tax=Jiangella ureilytica TaxID=2530374 RepID=A0A4R4RWJ6_9ACTN|nr:FAD-dependent oxidoreductase [Jiangella ureilytica]TDC53272.1 FAD-dependent oxidoreductase [Jiangella ureilytica]